MDVKIILVEMPSMKTINETTIRNVCTVTTTGGALTIQGNPLRGYDAGVSYGNDSQFEYDQEALLNIGESIGHDINNMDISKVFILTCTRPKIESAQENVQQSAFDADVLKLPLETLIKTIQVAGEDIRNAIKNITFTAPTFTVERCSKCGRFIGLTPADKRPAPPPPMGK